MNTLQSCICGTSTVTVICCRPGWSSCVPTSYHLFCVGFSTRSLTCYYKEAYITPRIKKANLNLTETRSYRPVSNLPVVSKLLKRLVSMQLDAVIFEVCTPFGAITVGLSEWILYGGSSYVIKLLRNILLLTDRGDLATLTFA